MSRANFGSELVVSLETNVTYLEEFCFTTLFHGAVLAASHREEEGEYSEIGDAGVERSSIHQVGCDCASGNPHVAKVAWCCGFLAVLLWIQLFPCFLENFYDGMKAVAVREVAGAWPIVMPEPLCHVAKGLFES